MADQWDWADNNAIKMIDHCIIIIIIKDWKEWREEAPPQQIILTFNNRFRCLLSLNRGFSPLGVNPNLCGYHR